MQRAKSILGKHNILELGLLSIKYTFAEHFVFHWSLRKESEQRFYIDAILDL